MTTLIVLCTKYKKIYGWRWGHVYCSLCPRV